MAIPQGEAQGEEAQRERPRITWKMVHRMICLYIMVMTGAQVRKLRGDRVEVRVRGGRGVSGCIPAEWPPFDRKTLDQMIYLYAVIMAGWQVRKLPKLYTDGKPRFELLRGHLPV
jgi:hypothetical protein